MVEWVITNSVFTLNFDIALPLDTIFEKLKRQKKVYVTYNPTKFSGLTLYTNFTKGDKEIKFIVFSNGVINIAGLKDLKKLDHNINKIRKVFKKAGVELPEDYELKVTNIVINGKFDYDNIDLEKMYKDLDDAKYDPERFPGLSTSYYLSEDYKVTFTIFRNGRFVCTGIKSDISDINQHINEIVNSFQENVIKKYAKQ